MKNYSLKGSRELLLHAYNCPGVWFLFNTFWKVRMLICASVNQSHPSLVKGAERLLFLYSAFRSTQSLQTLGFFIYKGWQIRNLRSRLTPIWKVPQIIFQRTTRIMIIEDVISLTSLNVQTRKSCSWNTSDFCTLKTIVRRDRFYQF